MSVPTSGPKSLVVRVAGVGMMGEVVTGAKNFALKGRRKLTCYTRRTLDQPTVLGFVSGVGTGRTGMLELSLVGPVLTEAPVSPGVRGS